jgi:nucleoside-diphosphate-sugar epimerase
MRVVITGAAGKIGREMVEELSGSHELCLIDRIPVPGKQSIVANLALTSALSGWRSWVRFKSPRWEDLFTGAEVVLHLAADVRNYVSWQQILPDNIQVTWNVIEAAAQHRVNRVVFASSNWAVKALERALAPDCYLPNGTKISSDAPPRPLAPYGVSKAFGEITGRMFVDDHRLVSFIAVRIGSYHSVIPQSEEDRRLWIGTQDLRSLLRRCVEAELEGFHVVYGISAQAIAPYDLSYTRQLLAWEPQQTLVTTQE